MAKPDPEAAAHLEWLGCVQPTGLVVSAAALVRARAVLPRCDAEWQRLVRAPDSRRPPRAAARRRHPHLAGLGRRRTGPAGRGRAVATTA